MSHRLTILGICGGGSGGREASRPLFAGALRAQTSSDGELADVECLACGEQPRGQEDSTG